jgi:hypothetical protein
MLARTLTLAALLLCAPARAHYIWLERDGDSARAYFGEYAENLREKAGGALDNIKSPQAFHADPATPLGLQRGVDHFAIAKPGAGDLRLIEEGMAPREDKRNGGRTKSMYYAKEGRNEIRAVQDLELVPATSGGNSFVVLLRGAPLPKAEVKVYAPSLWEKSPRSDEQGRVTIETPWIGRYVLEVVHFEPRTGEGYDRLRHVATVSFVTSTGIPWAGR